MDAITHAHKPYAATQSRIPTHRTIPLHGIIDINHMVRMLGFVQRPCVGHTTEARGMSLLSHAYV